jgi:hypothetical protein
MKSKLCLFVVIAFVLLACESETNTFFRVQIEPSLNFADRTNVGMQKIKSFSNDVNPILYAIQVYQDNQPFKYGLFDDISQMQIMLDPQKSYKIELIAIQPSDSNHLKKETDLTGTNYFLPGKVLLSNSFQEGDNLKNIGLPDSIILSGIKHDYKQADVFYCSKSFQIDKKNNVVDLKLIRMGFAMSFVINDFQSGEASVIVGNDTMNMPVNTNILQTKRLFSKTSFEQIFSTPELFSDSVPVKIRYVNKAGMVTYKQKTISIKRNENLKFNLYLNIYSNTINFEKPSLPSNGLVAWYPFNGNANDLSGKLNNGTVNSATLTTDRFGSESSAYDFNGYSSYISVPSSESLKLTGDKTISVWTNPASSSQLKYACFVWKGVSTSFPTFVFGYNFGNLIYLMGSNTSNFQIRTEKNVSEFVNKWTHFAVTYSKNSGNVKIYINGVLYQVQNFGSVESNFSNDFPMTIGMESISINSYFNGKIDDVALWNRELSEQEIKSVNEFMP